MLSDKYLREQLRIHKRLQAIADEQAEALMQSQNGSISLGPWRAETDELLRESEKLILDEMKRLGLDPNA